MDNELYEKLINNLEELKQEIGDKNTKLFNLILLERIIKRLISFNYNCKECKKYTIDLNNHINKLKEKHGQFNKRDFKEHKSKINGIISHLQKEHKLVTEGYYVGIYMSMGISLGLVFGLLLFDNIALGLPIGLSIGVAIGSSKDADAKKKGLII
ncbi:hypothetical protein [Romboutsia sp.]|uniref:hypothetical protein n=1 Tax=Romboutsia sp. TaxID=1965302 RepID=UPI002C4CBF16|nr:hypothetical protein [Romboutsia sp.]HSQ87815.1 hypothetical protein [Romboutsia sp.]